MAMGRSIPVKGGGKAASLEQMLAGVRHAESGSFKGNYNLTGRQVAGDEPYGAYQILRKNWHTWARAAGIPGASMESPQAQDKVAAYVMNMYHEKYGDWDLAALAWYAGPQQAVKAIQRGWKGIESIQNPEIKKYVTAVSTSRLSAMDPVNAAFTRRIPGSRFTMASTGSNWLMPVAGQSEYSNSFMVSRDNKEGIHGAIDVYAQKGTPIVSSVGGKVLSTRRSDIGGYTVRVQGDDGIVYYYAHMAEAAVVGAGQRINAGAHLGFVGDSGNAKGTTPHLHFSMKRNGKSVNPYSALQQASVMGVGQTGFGADAQLPESYQPQGGMSSWLQSMSNSVSSQSLEQPIEVEEESQEVQRTTATGQEMM